MRHNLHYMGHHSSCWPMETGKCVMIVDIRLINDKMIPLIMLTREELVMTEIYFPQSVTRDDLMSHGILILLGQQQWPNHQCPWSLLYTPSANPVPLIFDGYKPSIANHFVQFVLGSRNITDSIHQWQGQPPGNDCTNVGLNSCRCAKKTHMKAGGWFWYSYGLRLWTNIATWRVWAIRN